jgi:hypothetical protein
MDPDPFLVLCGQVSGVQTVFLDGKVVMKDGKITLLDEKALLNECHQAAKALRDRAGVQPTSDQKSSFENMKKPGTR